MTNTPTHKHMNIEYGTLERWNVVTASTNALIHTFFRNQSLAKRCPKSRAHIINQNEYMYSKIHSFISS